MENEIIDESSTENDSFIDEVSAKRCRLPRKQTEQSTKKSNAKEERNASIKKVSTILQKHELERTFEENQTLIECREAVEEVQERRRKRDKAKRRLEEFEDPDDELDRKCMILAQAIAQSQHLVVYTGAGISTAAKIPDYRGPNGIWTRLQQGKDIGEHDLTLAEPTYTHMALSELYRKNILKYVVSQNCDGLHLRSGLPRTALSELHGNMYIEVCKRCKPHKEYWRLFDVTQNTARYYHKTSRRCYTCNEPLVDTIVHFGERGSLAWPLNWTGACKNAAKATTILCLGSSLKVLKKYPRLWQMNKPTKKRANLYIVNLQWTPKDDVAAVKVHGRCDRVMAKVMEMLGISVPDYVKRDDPIYAHATRLHDMEEHTTGRASLDIHAEAGLKCRRQCVPSKQCNTTSPGIFSIENLLRPDTVSSDYFLGTDVSLFGYDLRMFNAYPDFFLYPYRTSFLYSGLHSIINPLPRKDVVEVVPPDCGYCVDKCVFYGRSEPVFSELKLRYSKVEKSDKPNVCLCCDYSTDEDDLDDSNDNDKESCRSKMPAGWFGKGYKKGRRAKRKTF